MYLALLLNKSYLRPFRYERYLCRQVKILFGLTTILIFGQFVHYMLDICEVLVLEILIATSSEYVV